MLKKIILSFLLCILMTPCFAKPLAACELQKGDILFWADVGRTDRAGHVAIWIAENQVAHSTDNPKFNAFVVTRMLPSSKLKSFEKEYRVIRIQNRTKREEFNAIISSWLEQAIPFDKTIEKKMSQWDDSLVKYSTADKIQFQNLMFEKLNDTIDTNPPKSAMCSDIIIKALQITFSDDLPKSLHLDPQLCPPSTMMLSLGWNSLHFEHLGVLP